MLSIEPTSVVAKLSHQRGQGVQPRRDGASQARVAGRGRLLLHLAQMAKSSPTRPISSSMRWSYTLFSAAGNRLYCPPNPRMFQGSTRAPHSIARCSRSSTSSGSGGRRPGQSAAASIRPGAPPSAGSGCRTSSAPRPPAPRAACRPPPRYSPSARTTGPGGRAATAPPAAAPDAG